MAQFRVQMINKYTNEVIEDCVDDMIFDSEEAAEEYACYMNSCSDEGAEILKMSNPYEYEEDYGNGENYEYIAESLDY